MSLTKIPGTSITMEMIEKLLWFDSVLIATYRVVRTKRNQEGEFSVEAGPLQFKPAAHLDVTQNPLSFARPNEEELKLLEEYVQTEEFKTYQEKSDKIIDLFKEIKKSNQGAFPEPRVAQCKCPHCYKFFSVGVVAN